MHMWLVESSMVTVFAKSQFYPTSKEYILFNYHGGCETLRWLTASQSQLNVINNPSELIRSNIVLRFT